MLRRYRVAGRSGLLALAVALLVSACESSPATPGAPGDASSPAGAEDLVPVTVEVPAGMDDAPLDTERQALVPAGWTMSVFARVPSARLAAWAPDGALLVSVPDEGSVVRLTPDGRGAAAVSVLLTG